MFKIFFLFWAFLFLVACQANPKSSEIAAVETIPQVGEKNQPDTKIITFEELKKQEHEDAVEAEKKFADDIKRGQFASPEQKKLVERLHSFFAEVVKGTPERAIKPALFDIAYDYIDDAEKNNNMDEILEGLSLPLNIYRPDTPDARRLDAKIDHLLAKYPKVERLYSLKIVDLKIRKKSDFEVVQVIKKCFQFASETDGCRGAYDLVIKSYQGEECLTKNIHKNFGFYIGSDKPEGAFSKKVDYQQKRSFYISPKPLLRQNDFDSIRPGESEERAGINVVLKPKSLMKFRKAISQEDHSHFVVTAIGDQAVVYTGVPYEFPDVFSLYRAVGDQNPVFEKICKKPTEIQIPKNLLL